MKYLGIDFGSKRIGLAVSDENGMMAFPHAVILNSKNTLEEIEEIIKKEKIDEIVIGESNNFTGEPNKIMANIKIFAKGLEEKYKIKIHFESEFMTSQQAELIQGKNKMLDASAAAIILQSFLDRNALMI
jgi:putative holliday junction resolvase